MEAIQENRTQCVNLLHEVIFTHLRPGFRQYIIVIAKEVRDMLGNTIRLKMTHDEIRVLVYALNELRNSLIEEGRYTDAVDELLIKLLS